jgi:hypothetical protein
MADAAAAAFVASSCSASSFATPAYSAAWLAFIACTSFQVTPAIASPSARVSASRISTGYIVAT